MVRCVSEVQGNMKPQIIWLDTEGDKIAPPNTYTASEKRKLHQFYLRHLNNLMQNSVGN